MGDPYCFVAMERTTKLVLNLALGRRTQVTTDAFIEGLRAATGRQRFQISTDGFQPYKSAIAITPSDRCDFAQIIKVYLWAAYCLHFACCNFCRIHKTLRVTPAMESGITGRVWTMADLMA